MIKPNCFICKEELEEFGGILLSPPDHDGKVEKKHICIKCYGKEFMEKYNIFDNIY
jgi:hypothetical protein